MTDSELKIGMVGAGFWAAFQAAGWHELEGVRVAGVYNRTFSKAEKLAQEIGAKAFSSVEEMMDSGDINVVDIVTDVDTHRLYTDMAVERRLPVISQKPMAANLADAREMVQNTTSTGVPFFVHENWRFQQPLLRLKEVLASGVIGRLFRARVNFCSSFPVFDNQPFLAELDRFILTDIGSHILDSARFLFGEAETLLCQTARVNPKIKGEDVATVMMRMTECPTVVCEMSYASRLRDEAFPQTFVVVEGENGSIELRADFKILVTTRSAQSDETATPPRFSWADPAYDLVHASIVACNRALRDDIREGIPSGVRGSDNLKTVELVFASYESAESGHLIRMEEF